MATHKMAKSAKIAREYFLRFPRKILFTAALVAAFPCLVQAAPLCLPSDASDAKLAEKFDERLAFAAVTNVNTLLKVFKTETGETWSVAVEKNGETCLVSAGEGWRKLDPEWGQGS